MYVNPDGLLLVVVELSVLGYLLGYMAGYVAAKSKD